MSRLSGITTEVLITLLHELRHAHQYDTWPATRTAGKIIVRHGRATHYNEEMERDAEDWAKQNAARWRRLVKVKPKYAVSTLRRLAAAEASAR
jgi:hypothetical protein